MRYLFCLLFLLFNKPSAKEKIKRKFVFLFFFKSFRNLINLSFFYVAVPFYRWRWKLVNVLLLWLWNVLGYVMQIHCELKRWVWVSCNRVIHRKLILFGWTLSFSWISVVDSGLDADEIFTTLTLLKRLWCIYHSYSQVCHSRYKQICNHLYRNQLTATIYCLYLRYIKNTFINISEIFFFLLLRLSYLSCLLFALLFLKIYIVPFKIFGQYELLPASICMRIKSKRG